MTDLSHSILEIQYSEIHTHIEDLCDVLLESVCGGAAIGFMSTLTTGEAEEFWLKNVRIDVENGNRLLFGAFIESQLVGTVQLVFGMPPNQPHRTEISKMMVHPENRRQGIGKDLMTTALDAAKSLGKTIVTLDTRTGDVSESLYRGVGFKPAGVIPDYAFDPDGKMQHATTYMYRYL